MYGTRQDEERLDPAGLEVPFAEGIDETESPYALTELTLGEETFATTPTEEGAWSEAEGLSWLESAVQAAETQAAEASEAEWLETEWLEAPSSEDAEGVESFAERIGREWSSRRKGDPTPDAMRAWLIRDHEDTLAGAKLRWGGRKLAIDFWPRITRAWMISREEQMRFQTEPRVGSLGQFAPPGTQVELIGDPLIGGSDKAPVAPLTARFAHQLRQRFGSVSMSNYRGHGGGSFYNRGYSLDLFLSGRDARGFYRKEDAIRLLRAVHAAAGAVQAQWRAIYNDFSVADAVNRALGRNHVIFVGAARKNAAKAVTGLNWHGPDPLILHVHLDLAPKAGASLGETEVFEDENMWHRGACCPACGGKKRFGRLSEQGEGRDLAWERVDESPADRFDSAESSFEWGEQYDQPQSEQEMPGETERLDTEWEWQPSRLFLESILEAGETGYAGFEETEAPGRLCLEYPAGYEKLIRRKGTKDGEVLDRTTGNRSIELSLQFRDYDVNAYLAGTKSTHSAGLARVTEFIRARLIAGSAVEVTLTGSASKTGTAQFNQELSEKRARCMAEMIRTSLTPGEVARIRFNERGEGFTRAQCNGADCELPGYRSVLVSVHAPDRPPPPIPPEVPGWNKFEIRCCAFQSTSLGQVVIDELLNKLPGGLPRAVAERLTPILKRRIEAILKRLLKRLPRLGALAGDLNKLLKFIPVEVTRQKAIFQIRERDKPNPQVTTLCYDGWGGRLALPIPGTLDDALDELLKRVPGLGSSDLARDALKKILKEELEKLLPQRVTKLLAKLDSIVPGPWKAFDLNRPEKLSVFAVDADIFVDVVTGVSAPGQITLGFDGGQWTRPDPARRVTLSCPRGCATSVIQVQVDGGVGFDLLSVNKGSLAPSGCSCSGEMSEDELFAFA